MILPITGKEGRHTKDKKVIQLEAELADLQQQVQHDITLIGIPSDPPPGGLPVTNIYVLNGKIIIEYEA